MLAATFVLYSLYYRRERPGAIKKCYNSNFHIVNGLDHREWIGPEVPKSVCKLVYCK